MPFVSFSDIPPEPPVHHVFMIWHTLPIGGLALVFMEDVVASEQDSRGFLEVFEELEIAHQEYVFLAAISSGVSCLDLSFLGAGR